MIGENLIRWIESDLSEPMILAPPHLSDWALRAKQFLLQNHLQYLAGFATSGSSGSPPKLILFTRNALLTDARGALDHLNAWQGDWISPLPAYHVGGAMIWLRAYLAKTNVYAYQGKWNPRLYTQLAYETQAAWSSLVPTQVVDLVNAQEQAPNSLKTIIVGGGRLDSEVGKQARQLGWPVVQSYGMTEAGSQIATGYATDSFRNERLTILPHWDVTLTNSGRAQLQGNGKLWGRLLSTSTGFQLEPLPEDQPWLTQDIVQIQNRQLTFVRRADRICKVLGELVDLDALEQFCQKYTLPCRIETLPDMRAEHKIILCGSHADLLKKAADAWNQDCPGFQRINGLFINPIPTNEMGKVAGKKLQEELLSRQSFIIWL